MRIRYVSSVQGVAQILAHRSTSPRYTIRLATTAIVSEKAGSGEWFNSRWKDVLGKNKQERTPCRAHLFCRTEEAEYSI